MADEERPPTSPMRSTSHKASPAFSKPLRGTPSEGENLSLKKKNKATSGKKYDKKRLEISYPKTFEHTIHVDFDATTGEHKGLPESWAHLLQQQDRQEILDKTKAYDMEEEQYNLAYSRALQNGESKNNRIPIMLVGQDRVGKTSLMKRLLGLPFDKDRPSTTGIDVNVIELTEQNAADPWAKGEAKQFLTSESEAKTKLLKKTAEIMKNGDRCNLEGVSPKTAEPVKPLLKADISEIKSQSYAKLDENDVLRVFVSDFAGQSIYYDTHGCFVKPHCPYVLVHDLSLEFDKTAVPKFKYKDKVEEIKNPHLKSNLDHFTSWLKFLQSSGESQDQRFSGNPAHCTTATGDNFKRPPVLIALTHYDKVEDGRKKRVEKRIHDVLYEGEYQNVIPGFFLIDCTLEGDDGDHVRELRRKLFELSRAVLNQENLMPVKWLSFEAALSEMLSPYCKYITVDVAKQKAEGCGVAEFGQAIKFLHRQGVVVHHNGSSKVVLDPAWLMNRFTQVISMPGQMDALSRQQLCLFEKKGILFEEYLDSLDDAELLKELLQRFNMICPFSYGGKSAFYVPSVVPVLDPGNNLPVSPYPSLFVTFPRHVVPMSLFTKLQVMLISACKDRFGNQQAKASLYCNYSLLPLFMDDDLYDVVLIDLHEFIKVTVTPRQVDEHNRDIEFAKHFKATLKQCLDDLLSPDQLLFSMTGYDLEVNCTCGKCFCNHETECRPDRCVHPLKLSYLQGFYNDRKCRVLCPRQERSSVLFDIRRVEIWLDTADVPPSSGNPLPLPEGRDPTMCYPMKQPYGFALIINIKGFHDRTDKDVELDERTGSDVDVKKLQDLWDQLGFEVRTHVNLKAHEIYDVVRKMANADALQNSSCFVCCIMTHGDMGVVYGSDSKSLHIKDIIDLFKQDNCSALTEKPKLFFIQACRGCQGSPPGMPEIEPTPELDASELSEADGDGDSIFSRSADPSEAHFLIGYSTVPDHASFRNVKIGTWYIDALVEIFSHYHKDEGIWKMIRRINNKVSKRYVDNGCKQCPAPVITLTKDIFF